MERRSFVIDGMTAWPSSAAVSEHAARFPDLPQNIVSKKP